MKSKQELLNELEEQILFMAGELALGKVGFRLDLVKLENYLGEIMKATLELKKLEGLPSKLSIIEKDNASSTTLSPQRGEACI